MTREDILAFRLGLRHAFGVWVFKKRMFLDSLRKYLEIFEGSCLAKPGFLWNMCIIQDHVL